MSEYIGSRISLISKSDIKYIGTLHEINSETHTVALESVTSYGTEGRKGDPSQEIPGSDQVYEYIVFRGSDVKELTIVAPPSAPKETQPPQVPNDPAILGSARPSAGAPPQQPQQPGQGQFRGSQLPYPNPQQYGYGPPPNQFQNQPRFQAPGGPHGFPGAPGAVPAYGYPPPPPGYGMGYGPPPGQPFNQPPPNMYSPQSQVPPGPPGAPQNQRTSQAPIGSKQNTPQPTNSQAPPPAEATLSVPAQTKPVEMSTTPAPSAQTPAAAPPPPLDSKPSAASATAPSAAAQSSQPALPKPGQRANANRVAIPLPPGASAKAVPKPQGPPPTTAAPKQPAQTSVDVTQAATAAVAAAMAKLAATNASKAPSAVDSLAEQTSNLRVQDGQYRGRGRGGRGAARGGRRDVPQQRIDVPKEDYDFESANAKFNKQDLVAGSPVPGIGNGDGAVAAPPTNGPAVEVDDVVIPPKPNTEKGYDKKSSFFDNISSDLKDRMEQQDGVDGRALRREERSRNFETFGQGSVDGGFRGGYRGRGGRGRGGGRGGPRGGYAVRGGQEGRGGFRSRGRSDMETQAI